MKDFRILLLVSVITFITYFGIEPLAHSVMHPHMESADFEYKDLKAIDGKGDAAKGKILVGQNCKACHTIKVAGYTHIASKKDLEDKYGKSSNVDKNFEKLQNRYIAEMSTAAVPVDLSNVSTIFDEKFLKSFIKNPSNAAFESTFNLHKTKQMHLDIANAQSEEEIEEIKATAAKDIDSFKAKTKIAMYGFDYLGEQAINDIVAYLKSIAKPLNGKQSMEAACGRCHAVEYDNVKATAPTDILNKYLGKTPPDLSMMIRSKGRDYLTIFLNDPQKVLIGSSMPRVGINEETEAKIVTYLENVGDAKKEERDSLGIWVILYFVIFTILAYLWKRQVWSEVK